MAELGTIANPQVLVSKARSVFVGGRNGLTDGAAGLPLLQALMMFLTFRRGLAR